MFGLGSSELVILFGGFLLLLAVGWVRRTIGRGEAIAARERAQRVGAASPRAADPPPPATPASAGPERVVVERQIIERQVLVERCRYCSKLRPVDAERCTECGAK